MNKKKSIKRIVIITIIVIVTVINFVPKKPFLKLKKEDIKTAEFTYNATLTIPLEDDELDQLIENLKTVEIYYAILEFSNQGGTSASSDMLYLEMQDEKEITISCNLYPARMRINGISFISDSEGSENIFELYNTIYSRNSTHEA